jgi:predicted small metal-binding protein
MAHSFACASTGADCPGSFTTESKDELLAHLQMHSERAHPDLAGNPDLGAMLDSLITVS